MENFIAKYFSMKHLEDDTILVSKSLKKFIQTKYKISVNVWIKSVYTAKDFCFIHRPCP